MRSLWTIIVFSVIGSPVRALPYPGPPDIHDPRTLEWATFDHPKELMDYLRQVYRTIDKEKNTRLWLQVVDRYTNLALFWGLEWSEPEDIPLPTYLQQNHPGFVLWSIQLEQL